MSSITPLEILVQAVFSIIASQINGYAQVVGNPAQAPSIALKASNARYLVLNEQGRLEPVAESIENAARLRFVGVVTQEITNSGALRIGMMKRRAGLLAANGKYLKRGQQDDLVADESEITNAELVTITGVIPVGLSVSDLSNVFSAPGSPGSLSIPVVLGGMGGGNDNTASFSGGDGRLLQATNILRVGGTIAVPESKFEFTIV